MGLSKAWIAVLSTLLAAALVACVPAQVARNPGGVGQIQVQPGPERMEAVAPEPAFRVHTVQLAEGGLPIALAPAEGQGAWVTAEFSNTFHRVYPNGETLALDVPIRASSGHYPYVDGNGNRSQVPQSERVVTDPRGRVWFPQSGHWLNVSLPEDVQNYSRIVSYQPSTGKFCVYPVPDNNAAVLGLAWDEARNLLWFTQSGNNALAAFNPDELRACDTYTNYSWYFIDYQRPARPFPLAYCDRPDQRACIRKYVIEGANGLINQLVVQQPEDPDPGSVWYTEFLGGAIVRFDPLTGSHLRFPLHASNYVRFGVPATYFPRVHQIHLHPLDADPVFSANAMGEVVRFDLQAYLGGEKDCTVLNASGKNPCMQVMQVPVFDPEAAAVTTHSMAFDSFGNLWVTTWAGECPLNRPAPGLAVIDPAWQRMDFLSTGHLFANVENPVPGLQWDRADTIPCADNAWPAWSFKGIVVDDAGDIWFSNYFQRLIHRLEFLGEHGVDTHRAICGEACQVSTGALGEAL